MGVNSRHWDPVFSSRTLDRDIREREERFGRYTSTNKLLVEHLEKPENIKKSRYQALLYTWVEWILAAMPLYDPSAQKLLIPETCGMFLIAGMNFPSQLRHEDFKHHCGKSLVYLDIVNGSKNCTTWVAS